jgi:hypothetical protein
MPIFDKFEKAFSDRDVGALGALFHEDYEMTMQSSGKVLTKQEWTTGFGKILASGSVVREKSPLCLRE